MEVLLAGIDHTSPAFHLAGAGVGGHDLPSSDFEPSSDFDEKVILCTCNRVEVYAWGSDTPATRTALSRAVAEVARVPLDAVVRHGYSFCGMAAIEHLMRVAAGLESQVLGEPQILGQVAKAAADARAAGTAGPILGQVFTRAVHAGKRARTETGIASESTSLARLALRLIETQLAAVSSPRTVVLGAGKMARLTLSGLPALYSSAAEMRASVRCINRSFERAQQLAADSDVEVLPWQQLTNSIAWADLVISATAAPHFIIFAEDVERLLPARKGQPLVILDLSVPRDVEPQVSLLQGVRLFDLDHLDSRLDVNLAARRAAVPTVEAIVREELAGAEEWLRGRETAEVIAALRDQATAVASSEAERLLRRLPPLDAHEREAVEQAARRIVNKLLHEPIVRLKTCGENAAQTYADALCELFSLELRSNGDGQGEEGYRGKDGQNPTWNRRSS